MASPAEDAAGDTLLSRSGASCASGKLTRRIDIPVSEEFEDLVISRAVLLKKPRTEFARELMERALSAPFLIGLPDEVAAQLGVLATISGVSPNELACDLLRRAVGNDFDMVQSMARQHMGLQCEADRSNQG